MVLQIDRGVVFGVLAGGVFERLVIENPRENFIFCGSKRNYEREAEVNPVKFLNRGQKEKGDNQGQGFETGGIRK